MGPFGSLAIEAWQTESLYRIKRAMPKELAKETQKGLAMNFMNPKQSKDDVPNNKHPRVESGKQRSNSVDFEAPRQLSQNDKGKRELGQASSSVIHPALFILQVLRLLGSLSCLDCYDLSTIVPTIDGYILFQVCTIFAD